MFIKYVVLSLATLIVITVQGQEENIKRTLKSIEKDFGQILTQVEGSKPYAKYDVPTSRKSKTRESDNRYDFIIVGAGSSGSVLANRLSEVPTWRILLIEAGKAPNVVEEIPAASNLLQFSEYNWNYLQEPQNGVGLGLRNQTMSCPRGRGLGGTSLLSHSIYSRGNHLDFDQWAAIGNPGWSSAEILPYLKKSEDYLVERADPGYHSLGGPMTIEEVPTKSKLSRVFLKAAEEMGYNHIDYNGKNQNGASNIQATLKNGRKVHAENAYLRGIKNRPNLTILTEALVTKVLLDPITNQAVGVEYLKNGKSEKAQVSKEVILSAGVINSPKILMLSGIGPGHHLESLGIQVRRNLPVGLKLYDHLAFFGLTFTANETLFEKPQFTNDEYKNLIVNGDGPLTIPSGLYESLTYLKTSLADDFILNYPDIQLLLSSGAIDDNLKASFRFTDKIYDKLWKPLQNQKSFMIIPILLHPKSYGKVELKSSKSEDPPKIFGGYLTDFLTRDLNTLHLSIRVAQQLVKVPSMQKYGVEMVKTAIPGCEKLVFDSDPYWECALRHLAISFNQQVGTCKMGSQFDPETVVDHELHVHGVPHLRIVDNSVIPLPLSGYMHVPATVIGEKAADLIKQCWSLTPVILF